MLTLRHATMADAALLAELGRETFSETFAAENTPDNMAQYLASAFGVDIQTAELAEPGVLFLIAEWEEKPVGYAQLKEGSTETGVTGQHPVELVRLYVRKRWHGEGIGMALMEACLREAAQMGGDVIWLGVWERNPRAIRFYQKWGFSQVGTHGFLMGNDLQRDWVLERPLEAD